MINDICAVIFIQRLKTYAMSNHMQCVKSNKTATLRDRFFNGIALKKYLCVCEMHIFKETRSVTINIFRKKNIFFLNNL